MVESFVPSHDWDCDSEPLLFDDEFCQVLLKDLQILPTPPQSPPTKPGVAAPFTKMDQLEFVSELLLEDQDFESCWDYDTKCDLADGHEDRLWRCVSESLPDEKLSSSPLLSDITASIFEEIAGSMVYCHDEALESQTQDGEDLSGDCAEPRESYSDYSATSTGSESSASDSEEEIDVVTVTRSCLASRAENRQQHRTLKRHRLEIQQQHNYAAPLPASPRRGEDSSLAHHHSQKRGRAEFQRQPVTGGRTRASVARQAEQEEEEEERRRTHNVMERQRRNELKNCFLRLRDNVPELSCNEKASKVLILRKARDSIRSLELENQRLVTKRDNLRWRQEHLRLRLEQLR